MEEEDARIRESEREEPSQPATVAEMFHRFEIWLEEAKPSAVNFWRRGLGFIGPLFLFLLPLPFLALLRPSFFGPTLAFYPAAAVFGVDVSAVAGLAAGFTWWYVFAWVMWGQMLLCAFLLWNLSFLRRWERADRFFRDKELRARRVYQTRPWMRKFHFWGLTLFTVMPVGSGIYLGVAIGKYTGMPDAKTWLALMLGTAVWLFLLVYFGEHFWDAFLPDWRWAG